MDRRLIDIIDLNIGENYLEDWEVYFALREIIANALDERSDKDIDIVEISENEYSIKDYGKGLKIENFIMMGSNKIKDSNVIGRFGIGLKDALAVLNNNYIGVEIITAKYIFQFQMKEKSQLIKTKTLHVYAYVNNNKDFVGTEFILKNCKREAIEKARNEFLNLRNHPVITIEKTCYGDILQKESDKADIYINGMKINEDIGLRFSYNIKNISFKLKKCLNRDRKYVSREAYRDDIKRILKECNKEVVQDILECELTKTYKGNSFAEINWKEVLIKTSNSIIDKYRDKDVKFVGNEEIFNNRELYDTLINSSYAKIIRVSQKIRNDIEKYQKYFVTNNLFITDPINIKNNILTKEELSENQLKVLEETIEILKEVSLIKNKYISIENIRISKDSTARNMHNKEYIIIPINVLAKVETCAVEIINVYSNFINKPDELKDRIIGDLIKIIYEYKKNK